MSKYNITTNQWGNFAVGPPLQGNYTSAMLQNGNSEDVVYFFGGLRGDGSENDMVLSSIW